MLEISHKQAQYLIRQSLDARAGDGRRLPEEQWAALQAHLEGCEACRAYRERMAGWEKHLRRTLLDRWDEVTLPDDWESGLLRMRHAKQNRARMAARIAPRALALLLVGLILFMLPRLGRQEQDRRPAELVQPTATATSEPTQASGDRFDGVVLYEARDPATAEGPTDIFLLRTGPEDVEISNMTLSPEANDTHPIWSPDGEWIAFLSDRSTVEGQPGKTELWVMTIAGTRLTQLTNAPGINWEGPLAWSPDGAWIALVGRREGLTPWVYLIPLMGQGEGEPVAVPGTRDVLGPVRFAPDTLVGGVSLYYRSPDASVIRRFQLATGINQTVTKAVPGYTIGRAFDARPFYDYMELIYTLEEQDGVSLWRMIENPQRSPQTYILDRLPHGAGSGLSFLPLSPRAAFSSGPDADGCRDIAIWRTEPEPFSQMRLGACLEGELDQQQWSSKLTAFGTWAVARGRNLETGEDLLSAVLVPHPDVRGRSASFYTLAEVPGISGPPRVRPAGQVRLSIAPEAALPPAKALPTVERLPARLGEVLMAIESWEGSSIVAMKPGVDRMRTILPADAGDPAWEGAAYHCPARSPDGTQIAFLSARSAEPLDLPDLYVLNEDTGQIFQRAMPHLISAAYDCPVWSPDGQALAVVVRAFGIGYLAVFSDGESDPSYMSVNLPSERIPPAWSADGSHIYLATPHHMGNSPVITAYPWRGAARGIGPPDWTMELSSWDDVDGLGVSADSIAMVVVRNQPSQAELRVHHLEDQRMIYRKPIGGYDPRGLYGQGRIAWMQGGQVVFAQYGGPLDRYKAQLWRYDPSDDTVQRLAATEDVMYDWAIQGGWLVFSTESGLWGDSIAGRLDDPTAPMMLADFTTFSLDWR